MTVELDAKALEAKLQFALGLAKHLRNDEYVDRAEVYYRLEETLAQALAALSDADFEIDSRGIDAIAQGEAERRASAPGAVPVTAAMVNAGIASVGGGFNDTPAVIGVRRVEVERILRAALASPAVEPPTPVAWRGKDIPEQCPLPGIGQHGAPHGYEIDPGMGSAMNHLFREWPQIAHIHDLRMRDGSITPLYPRGQ